MNDVNKTLITEAWLADHLKLTGNQNKLGGLGNILFGAVLIVLGSFALPVGLFFWGLGALCIVIGLSQRSKGKKEKTTLKGAYLVCATCTRMVKRDGFDDPDTYIYEFSDGSRNKGYDCFDVEEGEEVYLVFIDGESTHSGCLKAALYEPDIAVKVADKRA